jgi:hypothetical protein
VAGVGEDREHLSAEVSLGRFTVETKEFCLGVRRSLVDVSHSKAFISGEVFDVVGRVGKAG